METFRGEYEDRGTIYVRGLQIEPRSERGWIRGRLSGPEITMIRQAAQGVPALALMYSGQAENPNGWYPTLVLPPDTPTYLLNPL
jgi:hypothetical protein